MNKELINIEKEIKEEIDELLSDLSKKFISDSKKEFASEETKIKESLKKAVAIQKTITDFEKYSSLQLLELQSNKEVAIKEINKELENISKKFIAEAKKEFSTEELRAKKIIEKMSSFEDAREDIDQKIKKQATDLLGEKKKVLDLENELNKVTEELVVLRESLKKSVQAINQMNAEMARLSTITINNPKFSKKYNK